MPTHLHWRPLATRSNPISGPDVGELMRCTHCGDIIGVYEPLVALTEGRPLETSLAAGTIGSEHDANCYHRDCYTLRHGADALGA